MAGGKICFTIRPWLICLAVVLTVTARISAQEAETILYLYTRDNYFDSEVVADFEQRFNCRIDFDYYDSNDTMFERVKEGVSGYDLIVATSTVAEEMYSRGLLINLNRTLIPNFRHLDTTLLVPFPDLEMRYHAPYTWSVVGIGYNSNKVPAQHRTGWDIFSRTEYQKAAAMMNDPRYVIGAALKNLGLSLNTRRENEIRQAGEILRRWKGAVAMFGIDEPIDEIRHGELNFIQCYNGDIAVSITINRVLDFFVPEEGSILNSDCFVIPVGAENQGLSHAFINHMFNPRVAAKNMASILYYMPNRAALAQLPPEILDSPYFSIPRNILDKCEPIKDVGDSQVVYDEIWETFLFSHDD